MFAALASIPPLSIVTLSGELTSADVELLRAHYSGLHAAGARFAAVVDCRRAHMPSDEIRLAIDEMSNSFTGGADHRTICAAVLLDSAALVTVLNSLRFLLRTAVEIRCFSSAPPCLRWLNERLAAEGITLDDNVVARLSTLDPQPMLP